MNPKDKLNDQEKSGIYEIWCEDCDMVYIGQSCRSIKVRFEEHISKFRRKHFDTSANAAHMFHNKHDITIINLKLLENVRHHRGLDFLDTVHINSADPDLLLNGEGGPCIKICVIISISF